MALPATDSFTNTNGTALTTHDSSWTLNQGNFSINTNAIHGNDSGSDESGAHWNADAFADNHYSQLVHTAEVINIFIGVGVRMHASAATYYGAYWDNADYYIFKVTAGTWVRLGVVGTAAGPDVGAVVRLEATGQSTTTLELFFDGSSITTRADSSSPFLTGSAGLVAFDNETGTRGDSWEGGNLQSIPIFMHHYRNLRT